MMYIIAMTMFIALRIVVKLITLVMSKDDRLEINKDIRTMRPDKKDF